MDIEGIEKQYAELYKDKLLIENQKNKIIKELKNIIKTKNITSLEDEEKNEEIQKLKVRIQEIQVVLDDLEKEKKDFFNNQKADIQKTLKKSEQEFKRKTKEQEIDDNFLELLKDLKVQEKASRYSNFLK